MSVKLDKPFNGKSKFGTLVLSIAIFIFLDLGVLTLNYFLSLEFQKDAVNINLAGRQRMLSQKISKSLAFSQQAWQANDHIGMENAYTEAFEASKMFGQTLQAFARGGMVVGADKKNVNLLPVNDELQEQFITKATALWAEFGANLQAPKALNRENLEKLNGFMIEHNLELLALMNGLTVGLESASSTRAKTLRNMQTTAMILAIVNFVFILLHFIRQLRQRDTAIIAYADGLLHHLESVERQVREEKASLLSQLESKNALVDDQEAARRRRAIATALKRFVTQDQLMQALWIWEEDASSRLPRVSLFPYVKLILRKLHITSDKDSMYMELTHCYAQTEKKLDPDPLDKMIQWRALQSNAKVSDNGAASTLIRLINYIHALDAHKAIELKRHILSLQPQLHLSEAEQSSLREWLLGGDHQRAPSVGATKVRNIIGIVRHWCQSNFPPLVSQQIERIAV